MVKIRVLKRPVRFERDCDGSTAPSRTQPFTIARTRCLQAGVMRCAMLTRNWRHARDVVIRAPSLQPLRELDLCLTTNDAQ